MKWCRAPYRWLWSTAHKNVYSILEDLFIIGPKNVLRWMPVIWLDSDFDWDDLATVMEYKLRRMSRVVGNGHTLNCGHYGRQMLICAEILKRLREDDYGAWMETRGRGRDAARLYGKHMKSQQELLGKLIGRHLRAWWD
jgi:hypothetical protein